MRLIQTLFLVAIPSNQVFSNVVQKKLEKAAAYAQLAANKQQEKVAQAQRLFEAHNEKKGEYQIKHQETIAKHEAKKAVVADRTQQLNDLAAAKKVKLEAAFDDKVDEVNYKKIITKFQMNRKLIDKCNTMLKKYNKSRSNKGLSDVTMEEANEMQGQAECIESITSYEESRVNAQEANCPFGTIFFDTCILNQCNCPNGTPVADGAECGLITGFDKCASCDPGYHFNADLKLCEINVCNCVHNGIGAQGPDCPEHEGDSCGVCDNGYYRLQNDNDGTFSCPLKECTCTNGTGATGVLCLTHGQAICHSCISSHIIQGTSCVEKHCPCNNGNVSTGDACPVNGNEYCSSCNTGYHTVNSGNTQTCNENSCSCRKGKSAYGTDCTCNGCEICRKCDKNYKLADDKLCYHKLDFFNWG